MVINASSVRRQLRSIDCVDAEHQFTLKKKLKYIEIH
jgi:hypothetical protein